MLRDPVLIGGFAASILAACLAGELLDPVFRPHARSRFSAGRKPCSRQAFLFRQLPVLAAFGMLLLLTGRPVGAAAIVAVLLAALAIGSNVKRRVLGEPLLFTDFAILGEMARHPRFYLGAVSVWARLGLLAAVSGMLLLLFWNPSGALLPRLFGLLLAGAGAWLLPVAAGQPRRRRLMPVPDLEADLAAHGLVATLVLYWLRWRRQPDAPEPAAAPLPPGPGRPADLVVVVQCESFADPVELGPALVGIAPPLPGLARARTLAVRHGRLAVAGFGAYTMRTEYGVLFGREEGGLGFRRFDPFLSARRDRAWGLPNRLAARFGRAVFVHPHDLAFYGRDRLMPAIGFTRLVGGPDFVGAVRLGPHVSDAALADRLVALIGEATGPTLLYAVTIENHGPWTAGRLGHAAGRDAYLAHLRSGDALLSRLVDVLQRDGRQALLVFFGDHRPSIPGVVEPGPDRDTPFVVLQLGNGWAPGSAAAAERLSPAGLHHVILDAALGRTGAP